MPSDAKMSSLGNELGISISTACAEVWVMAGQMVLIALNQCGFEPTLTHVSDEYSRQMDE